MLIKLFADEQDYSYDQSSISLPKGMALEGELLIMLYLEEVSFEEPDIYVVGYMKLDKIIDSTDYNETWSLITSRPYIIHSIMDRKIIDYINPVAGYFFVKESSSLEKLLMASFEANQLLELETAFLVLDSTTTLEDLNLEDARITDFFTSDMFITEAQYMKFQLPTNEFSYEFDNIGFRKAMASWIAENEPAKTWVAPWDLDESLLNEASDSDSLDDWDF